MMFAPDAVLICGFSIVSRRVAKAGEGRFGRHPLRQGPWISAVFRAILRVVPPSVPHTGAG